MGAPEPGAVVLVHFPFSELSQTKVRPAVVLADAHTTLLVLVLGSAAALLVFWLIASSA